MSIIQSDKKGICFICSRCGPTEVHHMLHGSRRAAADKYGLTVNLCRDCHAALHDRGAYDRELEVLAQTEFEKTHDRSEWIQIFGKNYREDTE